MFENEAVAVRKVVEEDDKISPSQGTPLAAADHEERDELVWTLMESQLSSLTLSEKMSERLWDENASLKQDKAILKSKLKA